MWKICCLWSLYIDPATTVDALTPCVCVCVCICMLCVYIEYACILYKAMQL